MKENKDRKILWLTLIVIVLLVDRRYNLLSRITNSTQNSIPTNSRVIKKIQPQNNGLITASQAIAVYQSRPDWARAECQILRRLNRESGQSANGDYWLSNSIKNYRMTPIQNELMNNYLIGNFCPDVF